MAGVAGPAGRSGTTGAQGTRGETGAQGVGGNWASYQEFWFDANRSDLQAADFDKVSTIARYLSQNPGQQVALDGSSERTNSVRNALLQAGVPSSRIQTGAYGNPRLQNERKVDALVSSQ